MVFLDLGKRECEKRQELRENSTNIWQFHLNGDLNGKISAIFLLEINIDLLKGALEIDPNSPYILFS